MALADAPLSTRLRNCLRNMGISNMRQVDGVCVSAFQRQAELGRKSLNELKEFVAACGGGLNGISYEDWARQETAQSRANYQRRQDESRLKGIETMLATWDARKSALEKERAALKEKLGL